MPAKKNLPLTKRQREVLAAVRDLDRPTLHELCERCNLRSTNAIRRHLSILERRGFLKPREFRKPRSITVAENIAT